MQTHKQVLTHRVRDDTGDELEKTHVYRDTEETPLDIASRIVTAIFSFIEGILALRLILSLFGANRSNAFADLIYGISSPLVAPFRGLFNIDNTVGTGIGRFEFEVVIAMLVYALLAWFVASLISPRASRL